MSLELLAAGSLLDMALGGIVGDAASQGAQRLWQMIRNRLVQNQPVIEGEIVEIEQNPTQEKLKLLEAYLQVAMHQDKPFAEAISKLGHEIANANQGNSITTRDIKAESGGVAAAEINAPNSRFGGSDTNIIVGKN